MYNDESLENIKRIKTYFKTMQAYSMATAHNILVSWW